MSLMVSSREWLRLRGAGEVILGGLKSLLVVREDEEAPLTSKARKLLEEVKKLGSMEFHGPTFVRLFKVNCYLNKPDVVLQPSLNDITTTLALLVRNLVDSARPFVRWMDGTCLETPEQVD
eukprot:Gb_13870 [translate_table: standard]